MASIEGLNKLTLKLTKLSDKLAAPTLKKAASKAMIKTYQEVKAGAPVGKKAHRTYKGRLVAPGYLKRTLKKTARAYKSKRKAIVTIKAAPEAFYGVQFIDRGTKYIKARRWFADKYSKNLSQIQEDFAAELRKEIAKIV